MFDYKSEALAYSISAENAELREEGTVSRHHWRASGAIRCVRG